MEQFGVLTLGSRLKRLSDHLFAQVQDLYVKCDVSISSTYFPILRLLQTTGSLSVVEVANQLHISHPAVSKQTNKMLKEGILEKKQDTQDQRRSSLCLSQKALSVMTQVEPILQELKWVIEKMTDSSSANFMEALEKLEEQVFDGSLADKVLDRLAPIKIEALQNCHGDAFYQLNYAWLSRYFPSQIMEYDLLILQKPQEHIIKKGGAVWVAAYEDEGLPKVLGTLAYMPDATGQKAELLKLSVVEHCQGKGIAQALLTHALHFAEQNEVACLTLETASSLTSAQRLYEKNGFVVKPMPSESIYDRSDVYMEKHLEGNV
ncbi:bifunctional helix-turn-helix transcriptional regulator/GNAT family N-acetyltransferase [Marinomonas sp.]|nr:bifunctional helix-turn-helix transcriptional regulator/GNAT family N-acetyltransferase [Marinomonas sp.]MDB4837620.1 bifunctional helix-turn-helix transcriptional regulator/GNAT family N-acetyltransferase [Marinomonas sp.]